MTSYEENLGCCMHKQLVRAFRSGQSGEVGAAFEGSRIAPYLVNATSKFGNPDMMRRVVRYNLVPCNTSFFTLIALLGLRNALAAQISGR